MNVFTHVSFTLNVDCESCILDHVKESTKCPTCDMEYGPTIHVHVK